MWRLWLILGLAGAIGGFAAGWRLHDWRDAAASLRQARQAEKTTVRQDAVAQAIAVRAQAAQDRIRTITRTLIEKVPVYVTRNADARFPLPWGFVRLHDAAVLGDDLPATSEGPGQPDDAPSGVAASGAAAVIVANYGACRADQQRLTDLQDWARREGLAR